jgi:dTDP-4-dehydrorhamnose 3,5-epimerase
VSYQFGEFYTPNAEAGVLFDDPQLGVEWPLPVTLISARDRALPPLVDVESEIKRRMTI